MQEKKLIQTIILSLISITTINSYAVDTPTSDAASAPTEKCYGIAKKGANDCASGNQSCAGSATADNQGDAFLFVPTGLCQKIVGGNLKPKTKG